jgi:hypothetical protein
VGEPVRGRNLESQRPGTRGSPTSSERRRSPGWRLASGNAKDAERVRIAGQGFMVVQLPGRLTFMSAPLEDEEVEDDESGKDSE